MAGGCKVDERGGKQAVTNTATNVRFAVLRGEEPVLANTHPRHKTRKLALEVERNRLNIPSHDGHKGCLLEFRRFRMHQAILPTLNEQLKILWTGC